MKHFFHRIIACATMICLLFSFVGCLPKEPEQPASSSEEISSEEISAPPEPSSEVSNTSEAARPEVSDPPEPVSRPQTEKPPSSHAESSSQEPVRKKPVFDLLPNRPGLSLAYANLNAQEQRMYRQLIDGASRLEYPIRVGRGTGDADVNAALIQRLYSCIRADFPELFYVRGASYEVHSKEILFYPQYDGTREEIIRRLKAVQQTAESWKDGAKLTTDYEKSKWAYEQVIWHTMYGGRAQEGQTVESVFRKGQSVCAGYAAATVYLLHSVGVPATVVHGVTVSHEKDAVNHAWVLLELDGLNYYMDPTWGDFIEQDPEDASADQISYAFLNLSDRLLSTEGRHHLLNNGFQVPSCSSVAHNYFVQEGLNLKELTEENLQKAVCAQLNQNQMRMTIYLPGEEPDSWKGPEGSRKYAAMRKAVEKAIAASDLPCKDPKEYQISMVIYGDVHLAEVHIEQKEEPNERSEDSSAA